MSGTGLGIGIEPRRGARHGAPALYDDVWALFDAKVHKHCKRAGRQGPYRLVLADYWGQCKGDGRADDRELLFAFMDGGGTCGLSAHAAHHWCELLRSKFHRQIAKLAAARGFDLVGSPPSVAKLLARGPTYPLVEIGATGFRTHELLCAVTLADDGVELFSDEGVELPVVSKLPPAAQKRLRTIATTKACECNLCERLRRGSPGM